MTEDELKSLLLSDTDMLTVLTACRDLNLPDCWLAAGAVRNAIWNHLSDRPLFDRETDMDVVFFDLAVSEERTLDLQRQLQKSYPTYHWEVKNQAAMYQRSPNSLPYTSACDAISRYPETCTAIAVRLIDAGELELFAPYGLEDMLAFTVKPTPHFLADSERMILYRQRLSKKNWASKWPKLQVVEIN